MNKTRLRAFVRGYWENADHETKKGEPEMPEWISRTLTRLGSKEVEIYRDTLVDYWYERGIKDLAEMVLGKLGEKE